MSYQEITILTWQQHPNYDNIYAWEEDLHSFWHYNPPRRINDNKDWNYISHDSLFELELSAASVSRSRRWSEVHWWSASGFIIAHWARALTLISKGEFDVTAGPKKSIERESPTFPRLHSFSRGQVRIRMVIRVYIASSSGSVAVSNMFTSRLSELRVVKQLGIISNNSYFFIQWAVMLF